MDKFIPSQSEMLVLIVAATAVLELIIVIAFFKAVSRLGAIAENSDRLNEHAVVIERLSAASVKQLEMLVRLERDDPAKQRPQPGEPPSGS